MTGAIKIALTEMPNDNGNPIIGTSYALDGGSPNAMGLLDVGEYVIFGLTEGRDYSMTVFAENIGGLSLVSDVKIQKAIPAPVPDAFEEVDWDLIDAILGDTLEVIINSLPDGNGLDVLDIMYNVNGGVLHSSFGIGNFYIADLIEDNPVDIKIFAVSAGGISDESDEKTETPTAPVPWDQNYVDNNFVAWLTGVGGQVANSAITELSIWNKPNSLGAARNVFYFSDAGADFRFRLEGGKVDVSFRDPSGLALYASITTNDVVSITENTHVYFAANIDTLFTELRIDGRLVPMTDAIPIRTGDGVIKLAGVFTLFATNDTTNLCDMLLSDVFFESGHAELHGYEAFVDVNGQPIDITQLGNPDVLLTGVAADYEAADNEGGMALTLGETGFTDTDAPPVVTVPLAPADSSWSVVDVNTGSALTINISEITGDGGGTISDILYRIDGGSFVPTGFIEAPVIIPLTGLTEDQDYDIEIVYDNERGRGDVSNIKQGTPTTGATAWYEPVWNIRRGVGIGWDGGALTLAADWAAATAGVSINGTILTVDNTNLPIDHIDFSGLSTTIRSSGNKVTDCVFDAEARPTNLRILNFERDGIIEDCTFNNFTSTKSNIFLYFNSANASHDVRVTRCHFIDSSTDTIKAPNGAAVMIVEWCSFEGGHLSTNAHLDFIDLKKCGPGSIVENCVFIGDYSGVRPDVGSTEMNNMIRRADGYVAIETTFKRCIFVGSSDPFTQAFMLAVTLYTPRGSDQAFSECLMDKREHNDYLHGSSGQGIEDWDMILFDSADAEDNGIDGSIGAFLPYPWLGDLPATKPDAPLAPIVIGGAGQVTVNRGDNPWNRRAEITSYDLRHSPDNSTWVVVNDIVAIGEVIGGLSTGPVFVQTRAINTIDTGDWSPSGEGVVSPFIIPNVVDNNAVALIRANASEIPNTPRLEYSTWAAMDVTAPVSYTLFQSTSNRLRVRILNGQIVIVQFHDDDDLMVWSIQSVDPIPLGELVHVYVAIDLSVPSAILRINGVAVPIVEVVPIIAGSGVLNLDEPLGILSTSTSGNRFDGQVHDLYVDSKQVRGYQSFISGGGLPLDISSFTDADILFTNNAAAWEAAANEGIISVFLGVGGFTDV